MVNVAVAAHAALTAPSAASVSRPLAYLTAPSNTTSATGGGFKAHPSQHTTVPRRPPTAPTAVAVAPVGQLHSMPMYGAQPHWPAPCMPHPNAMMMAQPSLHWPMISVDQSHCEEVLQALRSSNFFVAANDISVFTGAQRLRCAAMPDAAATALRVDADCSEPLSPLPSEYIGSVSAVNLVVAGVPSTMTAHELRRCLMDLGGVSLLAMHPVPVSPYESLMYPHVLGTGASVRWNVTVPTNGVAALVNLHRRLIVQSEQVTLFHSAEAADQWAILRDHCLATVRGLAGMHSDFRAASNALSIEAVHSAAR